MQRCHLLTIEQQACMPDAPSRHISSQTRNTALTPFGLVHPHRLLCQLVSVAQRAADEAQDAQLAACPRRRDGCKELAAGVPQPVL